MQIRTSLHAGIAAAGIAVAGFTAVGTASAAPVTPPPVPPGGLVTSFVNNQITYCSIICPLVIQTGVTAAVTTQRAPDTYRTARQSVDQARAIGVTAASITGPTNAAAERAIVADGTEVAPRALNAFETGVVGLLDVGPAAAGGPPAIAAAIETARQDTYTAMHRPIVLNPTPTVSPHGVAQTTVVAAIDVGAAVAFPAFNDVLSGAFQIPDVAARNLAATGDPAHAVAAGADTANGVQAAARNVVTNSITNAFDKIHAAAP